jgi:putative addiction module component (TIGR02574 family)
MLLPMANPDELLRRAMELPPEARAALAGSLLQSLESPVDADAEAAWSTEIGRRIGQLDDGSAEPVSWAEARRKITG